MGSFIWVVCFVLVVCVCFFWGGGFGVGASACVAPLKEELCMTAAFWIQTRLFSKPTTVLLVYIKCHVDRFWKFGIGLFWAVYFFAVAVQNHSHWSDTSRDHLVQLCCLSCWVGCSETCLIGLWVSPKTDTPQLLVTCSSIDDHYSKKKYVFFCLEFHGGGLSCVAFFGFVLCLFFFFFFSCT